MKDEVAVVGVGCTKFGDMFEHGYEDLICEAAFQAYDDAKIDPGDIQAAYLGTYLPGPAGGKAAVSLGDAPGYRDSWRAWTRNPDSIGLFGLALALMIIAWERMSAILFGLFFGGSLPDAVWTQDLGLPSFVVPYGVPDQRNHAPNENMPLDRFYAGIRTSAALLAELSRS